jgi:hypothetical protein
VDFPSRPATHVGYRTRSNRERPEIETVQDDVGDERSLDPPRSRNLFQRQVERQRGGRDEHSASGAVAGGRVEREPTVDIPRLDVRVGCTRRLVARLAERGRAGDRGRTARPGDARVRRQHTLAGHVPLQCLKHGGDANVLSRHVQAYAAFLRHHAVGEETAAGRAAEVDRVDGDRAVIQRDAARPREPPDERVESRRQ